MAVDLHVHSTASDGTMSPEEAVAVAIQKGLTALGIADHDSVEGVRPALMAAAGSGLEVFPALEISSQHGAREIHILGYLVDISDHRLLAALEGSRRARAKRGEEMVRRLQEAGVPISFEDVLKFAGDASLGRPHVAAALVMNGAADDLQQAFRRFLRRGKVGYVDRERLSSVQAVGLVRAAGGLPVLAHPGLGNCNDAISDLMAHGLGGIEAYHVDHTPAQTAHYLRLADRLGLVATGGSDSHGPRGPTPVEIGQVHVPDTCAEAVRQWGRENGRWPAPEG